MDVVGIASASEIGTAGARYERGTPAADPRLDLPPETRGARVVLREQVTAKGMKLAVVDDDPTGTQTVRDVPLVTAWDAPELEWAMGTASPTFAVLTNARAWPERDAIAVNERIGAELARVARTLGVQLRVLSRSDSTLRGHFPGEPEALAAGLEADDGSTDAVLICPAYPEAGRFTVGDVHWVEGPGGPVPVAETEFARDATFGYRTSNLSDWVRERAGAEATTASIGIEDVRGGGPDRVAELLVDAKGQGARYILANAVEPTDLDTLALGVEQAERRGMRLIYRTGPSFVAARAGRGTAEPLSASELPARGGRGLLVVGSHTALTTCQLDVATQRHELGVVTLDIAGLLAAEPGERDVIVSRTWEELTLALAHGDAALVTSRGEVHPHPGAPRVVADALVDTVRAVAEEVALDWIVAKGGITAHDMAVRALGTRRATVLGQVFRGQVSVWELGEGCLQPGVRYVVFPGNVGDELALAATLERLGVGA